MKRIKLIVSALLLAVVAWRTDWAQVSGAFAQLRLDLWLAAVGVYLLTQFISAVRWQLLSRPLGFARPLHQYLGIYYIGMFFNLMLPTSVGGDVVRAWYLDGRRGRRMGAFLSVLVDRGSGLLVLLALACVAMASCPNELPAWVSWSVWCTAAAAAIGGTILLLHFRRPAVGGRWRDLENAPLASAKPSRYRQLESAIRNVQSIYLSRPWLLAGTTALSILVQGANVVVVWLIGLALDLPVPALYYAIVVPMVTLLTLLPVSFNGMGIREGGMVVFLAPLGVAAGAALTVSLLWFAVFAVASLCGGAVYLFGRFPRPEEQTEHGPVGGHPDQGRARQLETAA